MEQFTVIIVVLILLVAVGAGLAFFLVNEAEKKKRSMAVIKGQGVAADNRAENEKEQKDLQNKRRAEIVKKLKEQGIEEGKTDEKKKATMAEQLRRAGMRISVKQYFTFSAVFAVVVVILFRFLLHQSNPIVLLLVFVTAMLGIPRFIVRRNTKRRQKKFLEEFADALDSMVRLLKAGMPVAEAIAMASKEFEGPVGEEMGMIYDAQKVGISLTDATVAAAERMPIPEMQMFATGVSIQAQTGASLSEVLTNLSRVIRDRFKLRRKVQALSSEAKSSAMIIGALPVVVGGGISWINPEFSAPLFTTTKGHFMLAGCAVWMAMGVIVMKIMINFKI
jgi:tight adherence protein B